MVFTRVVTTGVVIGVVVGGCFFSRLFGGFGLISCQIGAFHMAIAVVVEKVGTVPSAVVGAQFILIDEAPLFTGIHMDEQIPLAFQFVPCCVEGVFSLRHALHKAAFGEGNVLHCDIACIQPQCAAAEVPVAGDIVLHHSKTGLGDKSAVIGCLIFHFPSKW